MLKRFSVATLRFGYGSHMERFERPGVLVPTVVKGFLGPSAQF